MIEAITQSRLFVSFRSLLQWFLHHSNCFFRNDWSWILLPFIKTKLNSVIWRCCVVMWVQPIFGINTI